jgi:hypothetical protein
MLLVLPGQLRAEPAERFLKHLKHCRPTVRKPLNTKNNSLKPIDLSCFKSNEQSRTAHLYP